MMGPKCEREGIGQNVLRHHSDRHHTFCVTMYWGCCAGCAPCRVSQNFPPLYEIIIRVLLNKVCTSSRNVARNDQMTILLALSSRTTHHTRMEYTMLPSLFVLSAKHPFNN